MGPIIITVIFMAYVRFDVVRSVHRAVTFAPKRYKTETERRSGIVATTLDLFQITHRTIANETTGSSSVSPTDISVMNTDTKIEIQATEIGNEIAMTNGSMRDAAGTSVDNAVEKLITALRTTVDYHLSRHNSSEHNIRGDIADDKQVAGDNTITTVSEPEGLGEDNKGDIGSEHVANTGCSNQIAIGTCGDIVPKTSIIEWILIIMVVFLLVVVFSLAYLIGYIRDRRRNRLVRLDSEVTLWDATENQ